jgi:TRAP-type C4-dicarboxylate transport system substrate-binding protein
MKGKLLILIFIFFLVTLPLAQSPAEGKSVTLNLVGSFPQNHLVSQFGNYFVQTLNKQANGQLYINWKGAGEIIPTFDQPEALIKGVIDVGNIVPNYMAGVVPGAYVLEMSRFSPLEQGPGTEIYEYLVKMYAEKGIRYIGEYAGSHGTGSFYLFTRFKPEKLSDLAGKKIRVSPLNRQFIQSLGAEPITLPPSDIYLAMERGVVDGFIWPFVAAFNEMGFPKVVKCAIDLPVYRGSMGMFMNLKAWNRLSGELQKMILDVQLMAAVWGEGYYASAGPNQMKQAKAVGVEFVKFSKAENEKYVKLSQDALWSYFKEILSPDRYKKLRQLLEFE